MGLLRKTMSLSTMGVIDYRNDSERAAAAERAKVKAYKARTKMDREQRRLERMHNEAPATAPAPTVSPDGKWWWDGTAWQPMPR